MLAVYPGTFDPLTNSHSEIIKRTAGIFESVVVAVAGDTSKNTLFSLDERVAMVQDELSQINCKNLRVTAFHGLLVTFASQNNIKVIVRGLRALSDFEYEFKMAYMNKKLDSTIETIFIPATEKEKEEEEEKEDEDDDDDANLKSFPSISFLSSLLSSLLPVEQKEISIV